MIPHPHLTAGSQASRLRLPPGFDARIVARRAALVVGLVLAVLVGILLLPGLGGLRSRFSGAQPAWLLGGAMLKVLSMLSYVVLFRAVFCPRMSWRASAEIAVAELGANALIPTGGAGGLALGAWALRRAGMPAEEIGTRTVAFFLITSAVNVVALIIVGLALAARVVPGHASLPLTLIPAAVAGAAIVLTITLGRLAHRLAARLQRRHPGRYPRLTKAIGVLGDGVDETLSLIAAHSRDVVAGAIGYLAFDVMLVWTMFQAFGHAPPLAIVWIGYLIGQLGGILPLPGGLGGVDGGLIATYTVFGISANAAAAAVLSYRALALGIPALLGIVAFVSLRRRVQREGEHLALCQPGDEVNVGLGEVTPSVTG